MKLIFQLILFLPVVLHTCTSAGNGRKKGAGCSQDTPTENPAGYLIKKLDSGLPVDANWNKPQWAGIEPIRIDQVLWRDPEFVPKTTAKLMYDEENLYVIFKVEDKYVRSLATEINGPVWEDACVELFFAPDTSRPLQYFNLEINCGGTPLLYYNAVPREFTILPPEEISLIEIATTLPDYVYPEITVDTTWYVEYRLPFDILDKYSDISMPDSAVVWKANLYKIAGGTSNEHYLAWKSIDSPEPDFHRPEFFGSLVFE